MRHFIVIYQYGKVASTSLVSTLNALTDVEAVQAHFLGRDSLRDMVSLLVDPATSDYFHRHQVGQFIENAGTTRIVNAYREGRERESSLSIISLYRDPFDWFRSSILQDITGYLPALREVHAKGTETQNEEARIGRAIEKTLSTFSGILADLGGVDAVVESIRARSGVLAHHPMLPKHPELRSMFYMMLRPFSWFETHYQSAIGYTVDHLSEIESGVLYRKVPWASLFVLRYEAVGRQVPVIADRLGIGPIQTLANENTSETKAMSRAVREAFASDCARALKAQFEATNYARRFGYA